MKDTRFEHPEGPYKPWIGMRFFHERSRQVHAPGYYAHFEQGHSYIGGGVWRPDAKDLRKIRDFIVSNPQSWLAARQKVLRYDMSGSALQRMPRGYDASMLKDPLIADDLLWKDFTWSKSISDNTLVNGDLLQCVMEKCFKDLAPVIDYLCAALDLDF